MGGYEPILHSIFRGSSRFCPFWKQRQGTDEAPIWNEALGQGWYEVTLSRPNGAYPRVSSHEDALSDTKAGFEFHSPSIESNTGKEKTLTVIIDGAATNLSFSRTSYFAFL